MIPTVGHDLVCGDAKSAAPKCETCRHWKRDERETGYPGAEAGTCARVIHDQDIKPDWEPDEEWEDRERRECEALANAMAYVVDGSGYHAALRTFPTFGCILHTPFDAGSQAGATEAPDPRTDASPTPGMPPIFNPNDPGISQCP